MSDSFIYLPPPYQPFTPVYLDKDVLAVAKPSGLLTNPGRGEQLADCLWSRVQQQWPTALLVHRLDLATSGLVIFALRKKAEAELKRQFATRQTQKIYLARVQGHLASEQGVIDQPLLADLSAPPRNKVDSQGKRAITHYRVMQRDRYGGIDSTVVALWPTTGRAHQLRVHLAWLGHAILGDALYGDARCKVSASRLLLHAYRLGFYQPYQQQWLELTAAVDCSAFALSEQPKLDFLATP